MGRLLSVNNYHYRRGGSDVVYLEHAALMEELGWENAFFSMHHPHNFPTKWSEHFVRELEYGHSYGFLEKAAMAGKIVYSLEAKRKITSLVREFKPDVAHLHCIYHHLSPSIVPTLRQLGVPVVMTSHDLKIACPAYKMLNGEGICERCKGGNVLNVLRHRCIKGSAAASGIVALESLVQQAFQLYRGNISKIIAPSRFYIEKFVEWGWPREQFAYIPNYVDASRFSPRFDAGPYFLYFGRLAPEKGVGTLLRAARKAGVSLKIAGTGPEEANLKALHEELGGDVSFLGYKSGAELHELVREARAVVLPSEWYENAPMSVLESYALGKPVIGADIGGIPEMIVKGETGWVFESKSVEDLAQVLRQVSDLEAGKVSSVGRAGRSYVERAFNRAGYVDSVQSLYSRLMARR